MSRNRSKDRAPLHFWRGRLATAIRRLADNHRLPIGAEMMIVSDKIVSRLLPLVRVVDK
ncbi:MAG: hypothetical protein UT22_C0001G0012 [Parcubacteria group bacterium GW2011_GWC2_39_11]|nr:MAG: hypothetical protein UT22_C0001G0012 [Parcubacteria group bacterium GW2011_GWC2_39_11]